MSSPGRRQDYLMTNTANATAGSSRRNGTGTPIGGGTTHYDRERQRDGGRGGTPSPATTNTTTVGGTTGGAAGGGERRHRDKQDRERDHRERDRDRDLEGGQGHGHRGGDKERREYSREKDVEEEDRIGPYLIKEEIGRGSFATVFKGSRYDTNAPVAVKAVIRSKLTTKLLENLESEISILKRITHRNIVELRDCLKTDTHIYLIMAFCSAGDLSLYIRKRGDLPSLTASNQGLLPQPGESTGSATNNVLYPHPKEGGLNETIVRCFLGQLMDALRFLRSQNVIHRDIKPQNLLLQPADAVDLASGHPPGIPVLKVADFGFARWLPSQSLAETLCGSPLYMAPEILRYEKYDAKADLWSVGAVLYEMSVGKPPFRAQNHVDLLRKIERGDDRIKFPDDKSPPPSELTSTTRQSKEEAIEKVPTIVASDLKALIRRLLKRNPQDRMSFDDFFREANAIATGGTAAALLSKDRSQQQQLRSGATSAKSQASPRHDSGAFAITAGIGAAVAATTATSSGQPIVPPTGSVPNSGLRSSPSPEQPPESTMGKLPAYINQEPPAFARRPSSAMGGTGSGPGTPKRSPSFAPRYIVSGGGGNSGGGGGENAVAVIGEEQNGLKIRDFGVINATGPDSGHGSHPQPYQSRLNRVGADTPSPVPSEVILAGPSAVDRFVSSNTNSMTDSNESMLGKDYVVVEKRTVEINALADELANMPLQDAVVTRRPSKGFLSRPLSTLGTAIPPANVSTSNSPYPPLGSTFDAGNVATPAFAIPSQRTTSAGHPYLSSSSPRPLSLLSSSPRSLANPMDRFPGSPLALVGSPTAAIAKALNMASLKIFGSPTDGILVRRSSARKPITRSAQVNDPEEQKVLSELEDIAQKALVIFDFADSKIVQILPPTPQTSSSTSLGTPSYFSHVAAREQAAANPFSPIPMTSSPPMRRGSSSSSDARANFAMASSVKAEVLAAEAMVLYLKALAFLGKGIEKARKFWANRAATDQAATSDFNEAVQWFRQRFNECFDKADFAKSRCQDEIPESATFAEKLVYDRALEISRAAAVNELRGENPTDCETAYETALWMLYAILDESMAATAGEVVQEEDRTTVDKFVASITARLQALRRKIG